jgi:hypothetical protein
MRSSRLSRVVDQYRDLPKLLLDALHYRFDLLRLVHVEREP